MGFQQQKITRNTPIPLYYQLKGIILGEIKSRNIKPGELIPTENEFCEMYHISRTTVRQAITELVNEGKLYRIKSKGTFVSYPQQIQTDLSHMYTSFFQEAQQMSMKPEMKVSSIEVVDVPPEHAEKGLWDGLQKLIHIRRHQVVDGGIISSISSYLPFPLCSQVMDAQKLERKSMYSILAEKPETAVGRVIRRISAHPANTAEAKCLQIHMNDALILVENKGFSIKTGQIVIFEHVRYVGSKNALILDYQLDERNV